MPKNPARATASARLYSLQILRGAAAVSVVIWHIGKNLGLAFGRPTGALQAGVDVFFVISGIVIYMTGRHLSGGQFIKRRLARIVPLWWLLLIPFAANALLGGDANWAQVIASFLLVPVHLSKLVIFPVNSVGWTLEFEMYFYLIATLMLVVVPRRYWLAAIAAFIVAGIAIGAPTLWPFDAARAQPAAMILFLPISLEFVAGMILAHLWLGGRRTPVAINAAMVVIAFLAFFVVPGSETYSYLRPLYWGVPATLIVWGFISSEDEIPFGKFVPALHLGDASYALYLSHPLVILIGYAVLQRLLSNPPVIVILPVLLIASIGAAWFIHALIERRLVKVANRLLASNTKAAADTLPAAARA